MACKQELLNLSITGDIINNAIKSFALSKRYTTIMVRSSILNILHQRMELNKSDLKTKKLNDIPFVVFKKKTVKDPLLCQYVSWMKGIADAIDKNYLKEIFIFFKNSLNGELVESYRFYLKYNLQENYENKHTSEDLRTATQEMLQVICELGKHNKLNQNVDILLELTYFDAAPESYQPPGFEDSLGKYCLSGPNCTSHLATLSTGFHKLACYGGGLLFTEASISPVPFEVIEEEQKKVEETQEIDNAMLVQNAMGNEKPSKTLMGPKISVNGLNVSSITISDHCGNDVSVVSGKSESVVLAKENFNCICQLGMSIDVELITCFVCQARYHAPCHGYLNKEDASQIIFTCVSCNTNDQILLQFKKNDWPLLAQVRLMLYLMYKQGKFPTEVMELFSENDRKKILQKIESFNLLTKGRKSRKIDQVTLKQILLKFFITDNSQVL